MSPFHLSVPGTRRQRVQVCSGFFLLTAGKFRAYGLGRLHSKSFCAVFSLSPGSAWEWDRSGTIWRCSLPLSPSSCLGRPWAPRRTGGSPCPSESCHSLLRGHTSAGFQNDLEIVFFLQRCVTSCRAWGQRFAIFCGCWWDDWPCMDLPCSGQAACRGSRQREKDGAMGMAWNPPADIPWMWLWPGRRELI